MVMVMMMKERKKTDEQLQASEIETHCYEEGKHKIVEKRKKEERR